MAIDIAALKLWSLIRHHLPRRPAVLELGQSNWFGDVDPETVKELEGIEGLKGMDLFDLAKLYYRELLGYSKLDTVDAGGPGKEVHRVDLNQPLPPELNGPYDIIINGGTLEHIFDQSHVLRTIHHRIRVGGIMVHAFPTAGCPDHGFYTHQPCLLQAIARANGYATLATVIGQLGADTITHLAWRKTSGDPFRVPQQQSSAGAMGGAFHPVAREGEGTITLADIKVAAEKQNNEAASQTDQINQTEYLAKLWDDYQSLDGVHQNFVTCALGTLRALQLGTMDINRIQINAATRSFTILPPQNGGQWKEVKEQPRILTREELLELAPTPGCDELDWSEEGEDDGK